MSVQAQKFKIFEKKLSLGVRSPWFDFKQPITAEACISMQQR